MSIIKELSRKHQFEAEQLAARAEWSLSRSKGRALADAWASAVAVAARKKPVGARGEARVSIEGVDQKTLDWAFDAYNKDTGRNTFYARHADGLVVLPFIAREKMHGLYADDMFVREDMITVTEYVAALYTDYIIETKEVNDVVKDERLAYLLKGCPPNVNDAWERVEHVVSEHDGKNKLFMIANIDAFDHRVKYTVSGSTVYARMFYFSSEYRKPC